MVRAALVVAAVAVAAGCRRGRGHARADAAVATVADAAPWVTPTVVLDRVEVTLGAIDDTIVSSREVGRQFARCLIEAGDDVVALPDQVPAGRVARPARLGLALDARPDPGGAAMQVSLTATLAWPSPDAVPAPMVELGAEAPLTADGAAVATVAAIEELRGRVCRELAAQLAVLTADDPAVALAAPASPEHAVWTLAVIAARRPAGVGATVARLLDGPPAVATAARETLVALGDPSTVAALADHVDLASAEQIFATIDAVAAIGGSDAVAFLQVMAAHRVPAIADRARTALDRVRR